MYQLRQRPAYVLEFEASEEFLTLIDQLRGGMTRDESLMDGMRLGVNHALREARPDLPPRGKRRFPW